MEQLKSNIREFILGKSRDNRVPGTRNFDRRFVKDLAGKSGKLRFRIEVDQVMGNKRNRLES